MRVLVVETDRSLADTIAFELRRKALAVDLAHDGAQAMEKTLVTCYDVLVLAHELPDVTGEEVHRYLVERWSGAVRSLLVGTANPRARGRWLDLGADDYLSKPYTLSELVARVQALLRRTGPVGPPVLSRAGIRLNPVRLEVCRDERPIRLTPKEFAVLRVLLAADGGVVSTEQLLEHAWDERGDHFSNSVRTIMASLRRKLGPPQPIETRVGAGYRIG